MNKPLLDVLGGKTPSRIPVWLMRQAGRYLPEYREIRRQARGFLDLCYAPALAAEVTLQPIRRFGFDAAILFADILLVCDALGQPLRFEEGEGPVLEPVSDGAALASLKPDQAMNRLSPVFETVERVKAALPAETALIGFAGAPWTVASYMVEGRGSADQRAAKLWSMRDPEAFARLVDMIEAVTVDYLSAQIEAGAEVVQLFESWAGSLDEMSFAKFCLGPTRRLVSALKARYPAVPVIGFPRAAGAKIKIYADVTGVDAIGLDWGVPLDWARAAINPGIALQGNLDPVALVTGGDALISRAEEILKIMRGRRFIFNLGHGILPETPIENVTLLLDLIRGAKL